MSTIHVFPRYEGVTHGDGSGTLDEVEAGMSLRDVFAAAVLLGMIAGDRGFDARLPWKIADQVLAHRDPPRADPDPASAQSGES